MSLRVLIAMILAGTSLVGPGALAGQQPSPPAVDDPEAYRVYASLLSTLTWPVGPAKPKVLLIQEETTTWGCFGRPLETALADRYPTWKPVLDAYRAANQTVRTVLPGQELGVPYTVATAREIRAAYTNWSGYIQVSAVGFDAAGTRAMAYMAVACGGLCGGGSIHLLEKVNGSWRQAAKLCEWRA